MGYWKFISDFEDLKKKTLLLKTNLDIHFRFDVVVYYCISYNIILTGKDLGLETLMIQLEFENKVNIDDVIGGRKGNGIFLWDK